MVVILRSDTGAAGSSVLPPSCSARSLYQKSRFFLHITTGSVVYAHIQCIYIYILTHVHTIPIVTHMYVYRYIYVEIYTYM